MSDLRTRLMRLSRNLWWSWSGDLDNVFRSIDVELWRDVNHNPTAFLQDVDPGLLKDKERDAQLVSRVIRAEKALEDYLASDRRWTAHHAPGLRAAPIAYFSPEFALHESIPVYSGGLGALAGDHLKSCSDLGIDVFGVTLLYRQGYFAQEIDAEGHQRERYEEIDTNRLSLERIQAPDGSDLEVKIRLDGQSVDVAVWQTRLGRSCLIFLDLLEADGGSGVDRFRLYGGDLRTRILQELVLGVGGYRALRALGIRPSVLHMNEGHSAFAGLEAIADYMRETGLPFARAAEEVSASIVFTTHTPVDAGHDYFPPPLVLEALAPIQHDLGLSDDELLGLGRADPHHEGADFCMTVLALKLARHTNAVSALHGSVSRRMWHRLWPQRPIRDVPIGHITNGAHVDTWQANEIGRLFNHYLGPDWREEMCDTKRWARVAEIDDAELWSLKLALKRRLFDFIERRGALRARRLGCAERPLPFRSDVLTIAFARRFATYKRALLLFDDLERATRLIANPDRPIQIIFSGKAHPADGPGKEVLRRLVEISHLPKLANHLIVLENQDMNVSRHLLEGSDLWLNSPRRPQEACGTSGMKAVFNCALNCSTLDGWWAEAYDGTNGFAYGEGLVYADQTTHDTRDREALFRVLEREVVPCYYDLDERRIPSEWMRRVKHALETLGWRYNSDRMVLDYARLMYVPASHTGTDGGFA